MLVPLNWDELPDDLKDFVFTAFEAENEVAEIDVEPDTVASQYTRQPTLVLRVRDGETRRTFHVEFFEEDPR